MSHINVSIVLYETDEQELRMALDSVLSSSLINNVFLIDNSRLRRLEHLARLDPRIVYIFTNKNLGHGKAHNIALKISLEKDIKYHIVMNPDVFFESGVVEELFEFMEKNEDVGLVMPKVLYPDGSLQYLCKLLPTPIDLIMRRFLSNSVFSKIYQRRMERYELRFTGYDKIMNVPFLSGCFMFLRTKVLKKTGLFDERFFLYCDDLDLCRRIGRIGKTVFYPYVSIYHHWKRGSYTSKKLLFYHVLDAIRYFNKWGWFFDKERKEINEELIKIIRGA